MEQQRVFLAILLCLAVLAIYQAFFAPPLTPPSPAPASAPAAPGTAASSPPSATPPASPGSAASSAASPSATAPAAPATAPAATLVGDAAARDIVVETNDVEAVFTTEGATLKSWKMKRHLEGGKPLELVPENIPDIYPRPFAISTDDPALSKTLATALFQPSVDGLQLGAEPGALRFAYKNQAGVSAQKTFYFQPERKPYVLRVEAGVEVGGASKAVTLAFGPALGLGYAPDGSRVTPVRAVQNRAGKIERLTASALQKQPNYEGDLKFAGVDDQYFLSAVLPGDQKIAVTYQPLTLPVPNDPKNRTRSFIAYSVSVPGPLALPYYLGPKQFDTLRDVDPRLELMRAIDFGIFSPIVVQFLLALKWINGFVHNWGWSIIVLTVILNVLMFPLRHSSMVSMRKMQAVQPEIKAIQDRYAKYKVTDPEKQKMNQEMMALYKQKGINPASGCVPMLLTLPILWAFYALLSAAIELRGAPFVGWITDLSRHDPLYITPVLMGLSMLAQNRMMPSTGDPTQRNMMMLMPVVFTATSFFWPSGLVLYWLAGNLLAIGQQYITGRIIGTPAPVRVQKPAGKKP